MTQYAGSKAGLSHSGLVRGVQFRGQEVGESVQEKGNPLLVADEPHASGRIDALSACLPASPVRESHVAQEAPLRVRCGWCRSIMAEGELSPEGLESTGICTDCSTTMLINHPRIGGF